ncbi:OmpA family protein [Caballeronia sp. BR00000012568055]|uniref:OmpA family protein n=1 Tax=Caballeronia sp. BR00000012568055 TaxID=2918761 RepID=UPI0023F81DC0|nr:OmpA family protein [Caballeronia sp. BR00000012568055]
MSINLVQAVNSTISESIGEQLAQQFGIPGQIVRQIASRTAPGVVAMMMDRASLAPGARSLFNTVMLPETNAHIVDQLDKLISTTGGLKHLEANGHSLYALVSGHRMDLLTDAVAAETGVPTQATSALAGVVAAVLFGIVKRHFLLAQWGLAQLPLLLRDQVGEIKASMSNAVATAIGVTNTDGFTNSIIARLDAVGSVFEERQDAANANANANAAGTVGNVSPKAKATVPAPDESAAPAAQPPRQAVRKTPPKRSNKWVWLLFAVLAAILALVYYHGFTRTDSVSLNPPVVTAPVAPEVQPVASAPSDESAQAVVTASETAAAVPVVAASASAAPAGNSNDAKLVFNVSAAGVPTVEATVGTEAEKQQLIAALTHRFEKKYVANISVVPGTSPAAWLSRLKDFVPLMAVPGAEVTASGSKIELSGTAANSSLGWLNRLKAALGGMFQVSSFDADSAVASATQSFRSAMKVLLATDDACSGDKLTKVLDLQVVNFARSSATVPENAYSTLGETAQLLKSCAAKGSMVNLEIAGYSDSVGTEPVKLEMSKERAQSVRGFLVRAGVPSQTLTATGHGDANPVADNATASGRFANRRIEFVVK